MEELCVKILIQIFGIVNLFKAPSWLNLRTIKLNQLNY